MNKLLSFLNKTSGVRLVANDTLPDKPLVTPLMDKQNNPKSDTLGNPIGSIRLEQNISNVNGSYLNARNRVAFIAGSMEQLQKLITDNNLKVGDEVPGKIIVSESLRPMWPNQTPKINPETMKEIGVTLNNVFYPVYMKQTYTEDMTAKDSFIRTEQDVINILAAEQAALALQQTQQKPVVAAPAVPA